LLLRLPLQVACICDPSYPEKHKIERQWSSQPGQKERPPPISKITRARRAGGVTQAVARLPSKCEALSSNPSTAKKNKKVSQTSGLPWAPSPGKV
jgi:hypothetical protein